MLLSAVAGSEPLTVPSAGGQADQVVASLNGLTRQAENLDRGVIAMRTGSNRAYVGWRLLGLDPTDIAFNLYRSTAGGATTKLNASPITLTTDYVDNGATGGLTHEYHVRAVVNGVEGDPSGSFTLAAGTTPKPFLEVPISSPSPGDYQANDASVGDVDGDGQYEIILKWEPNNAKDNSQSGLTDNVYIDAYEMDGTQLWRIDLGRNIRAGAHYTQFTVYDLDGDGRAEVAMKTAPGTIDGEGNFVLMGNDNPNADYRNNGGYILTGPEYFTVFDGLTGAELDTVALEPERGSVEQWGDTYGNRVDRFTSGVAYLDGQRPSAILGRGYYGPQSGLESRNEVAAYDFRDTNGDGQSELSVRWVFEAATNGQNSEYIGEGAHSLTVGDVDGDGFDEVVYGAAAIDHDGTGLYATELGHGDALHLSDMDPTRPGLEVFMPYEGASYNGNVGASVRDAGTGQQLVTVPSSGDIGRGVAGDIDPNHLGYEFWATTSEPGGRMIYNVDGTALYSAPSNMFFNFVVHWDGDLSHELLDRGTISEWNNPGRQNFDLDPNSSNFWPPNVSSNNGTKATPALAADILGDWRDEVIWRTSDNTALHIYSTTIPDQPASATKPRIYTLMHDLHYRVSIAAQNSAYNQPPHPGFYLGEGMSAPPTPDIEYVGAGEPAPQPVVDTYQSEDAQLSGVHFVQTEHAGYNGTGYVNFDTNLSAAEFANVDGGGGGSTTISFRYALGNTDRTGSLTVNGVSQPITFTQTAAWTSWAFVNVTVDLTAGATNTIRVAATGQDLANIDELRVVVPQADAIAGDYNGDGFVSQGDLDLVLLNWGADAGSAPAEWVNDLPEGTISQDELDDVLLNWGVSALSPAEAATSGVMASVSALATNGDSATLDEATQNASVLATRAAASVAKDVAIASAAEPQAGSAPAQTAALNGLTRQAEDLDRGLVAIRNGRSSVYLSWRLLGLDPADIAFNVYRSADGSGAVRLNATPLTQTTDFVDTTSSSGTTRNYFIRPVINGVEGVDSKAFTLEAGTPIRPYLAVPLDPPPGGVTDDGETYTYTANDGSVGDLDGDGDYEIVLKWEPTNWKHPTTSGQTGNQIYDAYTLEGERLWRIDMGINIRSGPQYGPFQVYDYDGDGRAEFVLKTAPGTIDGVGNVIAINGDDPNADWRNSGGHINDGPEYLTVFDGYTGQALDTVDLQPARGPLFSWGDTYGNRANQFLMATAYLDGERPSIVFSRDYNRSQAGLPGRDELAAYNWRDGHLTLEWHFKAHVDWENNENSEYEGQGNHQLSVADVDGDGFDEIIRGASIIDHDGTGYYSSGAGHGDALHVGDFDPSNPGIEVFLPQQSPAEYSNVQGFNVGGHFYDADTKQVLVGINGYNADVGRGVIMDIDANYPGAEMWTSADDGVYNVDGTRLYTQPTNMFRNSGVWWDADPLRELLDRTTISKWNYQWSTPGRSNFDLDPLSSSFYPVDAADNNGTKANAVLSGDLLGDWREEVIWRNSSNTELHIYTTTIPAENRLHTLMHDSQYRTAIAWQNNLYNQPPHPSFFLGADMADPPAPQINYTSFSGTLPQPPVIQTYQAEDATLSGLYAVQTTHSGYNGTGYVNADTSGAAIEFINVDGGTGGATSIWLRYALGSTQRTGTLTVNGVAQPITFAPTGAWNAWSPMEVEVNLTAGATNIIRVESTGEDIGNLDELRVAMPQNTLGNGLTGDLNADGIVSQGDLDLVLLHWGASFGSLPSAWIQDRPDVGIVSQSHLDLVLLNWGDSL